MNENTNANVRLFTDSDLDGKGCAVLGKLYYDHDIYITYTFVTYIDEILKEFINSGQYKKYKIIYITDLNIKKETADLIESVTSENHQFIYFDHHTTSEYLIDYLWASVYTKYKEVNTCGTHLFYWYLSEKFPNHYWHTNALIRFVELVRQWDTWDWNSMHKDKGIHAKNFNTLANFYSTTKFIADCLQKIKSDQNMFNKTDKVLLDTFNDRNEKYCNKKLKNIKKVQYYDYTLGVCFAEDNFSDLGNLICREYDDIDIAFMINPDTGIVSLRTIKDDVNLSKFAEEFGGGGHPKSAGFPYNKDKNNKLINSILEG